MTTINTFADEVRQYCRDHYVEPARTQKKALVEIRAGDVHVALGYKNRLPLVCSALGATTFETMCKICRFSIEGPLNGSTTTFKFVLADKCDFNFSIPGYAKILDNRVNRTVIQLPYRTFPSIALQGDDLMTLRHNLYRALCNAKTNQYSLMEDALTEAFDLIDECYNRVCEVTKDPAIS